MQEQMSNINRAGNSKKESKVESKNTNKNEESVW